MNDDTTQRPRPWAPIVTGSIMGILSTGWIGLMGAMGWLHDPERIQLHAVVIVIQAVTLFAMLARTRPGRDFAAQAKLGLVATAVGSLIVFLGVVILVSIVFPDFFTELRDARFAVLIDSGMSAEEANEVLDGIERSQSPTAQGIVGTMGTLATGFVTSIAGAALFRDRRVAPTPR